MMWLAFALMTAAVALCLVWPLSGRALARPARSADLEFYRSQLAEVDDDIARGLVAPGDAAATRTEIGRRLLASANHGVGPEGGTRQRLGRVAAVAAAVVFVPLVALGLYLHDGAPGQPDMPIASRDTGSGLDLAAAIPRIEAHLAADPNDGRGFELIAPIYLRLGRFDDAAKAYGSALRILGESADRRAALGQARVMAADGVVTAEARADFEKAFSDDPKNPEARFFLAVAAEQDGDKAKARSMWEALRAESPPDAPWLDAVHQHLAQLSDTPVSVPAPVTGIPPGPAAAAVAALPSDQRANAIQGMVDGLAARLAQNGNDPEGWVKLIRSYAVLGEDARARQALTDARQALAGNGAALGRIDALAENLPASEPAGPANGMPAGPAAAAVASLPAEQRMAAIHGMVDGLAARLAQNGSDPEGWLRLIRSYAVLGDGAKAQQAVRDARTALVGNAAALAQIDAMAGSVQTAQPAAPPDGEPSGPAAAAVAALPPEQRAAAIQGMVDGLAARLAQNGRDVEGWLRLIKAYTVLREPAKAQNALADARKSLEGDAAALVRIEDLARQLGLEG